ncbi:uncharacterized protein [Neodiprion pinetum]|uniref:uncharacterized protein n=1 Tax=Neodiprion pinetum TaxID=441929 RepID=UPI001EE1079C|nr:uncharacterized protein LOC124213462 [Neodiprion pinetum]
MAKLQIALCFLLVAYIVRGDGIFGISSEWWESLSKEWEDLLDLVKNTAITNQTCVEESWDIEELSSSIQLNSSVSCLTELKTAIESESSSDTALLEIIDELIEIFEEGSTCASTEDIWAYVECYINTIVNAIKYVLTNFTTEVVAAWELLYSSDDIKSIAGNCTETIIETIAVANFKSAVQETVECIEKWTS